MNEINICLSSDDNYIEHMYVTIFSLLFNLNINRYLNIYILDGGLNKKSLVLLKSIEKKFGNCKLFLKKVNVEKYMKYPAFTGGTYQTYFRLDIPYLIPNVDKILYLDPDIVVNGDISNIYDTDISGYAIGAPTEDNISFVYNYLLKIPKKYGYFNAGVILMNLKYFRENSVSEELIDYLSNTKHLYHLDQDALNMVLYDRRDILPWFTNVTENVAYKHIFSRGKALIVHYCNGGSFLGKGNPVGGGKPWGRYCTHPYRNLYRKYRKIAGLDDRPLVGEFKYKFYLKSKWQQLYYIILSHMPYFIYYLNIMKCKLAGKWFN